VWALA